MEPSWPSAEVRKLKKLGPLHRFRMNFIKNHNGFQFPKYLYDFRPMDPSWASTEVSS